MLKTYTLVSKKSRTEPRDFGYAKILTALEKKGKMLKCEQL